MGPQQYTETNMDSWSLTPRYVWEGTFGPAEEKLTLGVDYVRDDLDMERHQDRAKSAMLAEADLLQQAFGGYIGSETGFGEQFVLSTSARLERAEVTSDYDDGRFAWRSYRDSKTFDGKAFSLGLTYAPKEAWRFYVRFDKLYRYPTTDEIADYQGAYMNDMFNDELDAETGHNYEIGISADLFEGWTLNASVFQLDMQDEIAWDDTAQVNSNLDDTQRRGLECEVQGKLTDFLDCTVTYNYVRPKFSDGPAEGRDIPLVPRQKLGIALEAELPAGFYARFDMNYTS